MVRCPARGELFTFAFGLEIKSALVAGKGEESLSDWRNCLTSNVD
jgi:hypothetical protein